VTALHLGGIPELAMALGPLLLIAVFLTIARRAESAGDDDEDDDDDDRYDEDEALTDRETKPSAAASKPSDRGPKGPMNDDTPSHKGPMNAWG